MGKLGAAEKEDPRFQELQSNSPAVSRSMKVALHRFPKDENPLEHADRCASWRPRLHQECGRTENNSRFFCAVPLQNLNSIVERDQSGAVFCSLKPIMGRRSVWCQPRCCTAPSSRTPIILKNKWHCAKKLGKGGRDSNSETFRWNPVGERIPPGRAWPEAGSESCAAEGQPSLRSVDSECPGRAIEPRKIIAGVLAL